jgi:hypothetical protein
MSHQLTLAWILSQLSPWLPWSNRQQVHDQPSVYLSANFPSLPNQLDPLDASVMYTGESKYLRYRLRQFDDTAFHGKYTHEGAHTYRTKTCGVEQTLYFSFLPLADDLESEVFRLAVERFLIWQYVVVNGRRPCANKK